MTRERAKCEIDSLDFYLQNHTDDYGEESHTAMMMAIKSLEQEPCEDCISRQEIDEIKELMTDINGDTVYAVRMSDLRQLPPVIPKQKIGHLVRWYETIKQVNCTIHDPHCKCSECDQEYDPYNASLFNYCPNCGAKMESEDK